MGRSIGQGRATGRVEGWSGGYKDVQKKSTSHPLIANSDIFIFFSLTISKKLERDSETIIFLEHFFTGNRMVNSVLLNLPASCRTEQTPRMPWHWTPLCRPRIPGPSVSIPRIPFVPNTNITLYKSSNSAQHLQNYDTTALSRSYASNATLHSTVRLQERKHPPSAPRQRARAGLVYDTRTAVA